MKKTGKLTTFDINIKTVTVNKEELSKTTSKRSNEIKKTDSYIT